MINPLFGFELELFVKLKDEHVKRLKQLHDDPAQQPVLKNLPHPFEGWDLAVTTRTSTVNLTLRTKVQRDQAEQRTRVHNVIKFALNRQSIDVGEGGWSVVDEPSLEEENVEGIDNFWRVEIISRPYHASEHWQDQLRDVYKAVNRYFDIKVTNGCSHHVHITPGTRDEFPFYDAHQVGMILRSDFYWEKPLYNLLPKERKKSVWAMAITDAEAKLKNAVEMVEDNTKPNIKWKDFFAHISKREEQGLKEVVKLGFGIKHSLGGVHYERYLSTNYTNVLEGCGTIEFRRQGHAHDYNTAVRQIVLALAQHMAALYVVNWDAVGNTKAVPHDDDYVRDLLAGMQLLPELSWLPEFPEWLQAQLKANKGKAPSELSPADLARVNKIKAENLLGKPGFQIPSRPGTPVREPIANILVSSSLPGSENQLFDNPWADLGF
ncbi:hypothetical protein B0T24DRAFT_589708 [Lasiosphaeria ovina]|uniref:Amidoligase enzyme n=1 Tax=Lasiosphaeria ovina TaxID=92902 RepID=A0AAE0KMB7_9PEZI|nr:hypothetical protein B0T24DRAFT_589708 [Lasiosphaeria ovina]